MSPTTPATAATLLLAACAHAPSTSTAVRPVPLHASLIDTSPIALPGGVADPQASCAFVQDSTGHLVALHLDSGALRWRGPRGEALLATAEVVFAAIAAKPGPGADPGAADAFRIVALDATTGAERFTSDAIVAGLARVFERALLRDGALLVAWHETGAPTAATNPLSPAAGAEVAGAGAVDPSAPLTSERAVRVSLDDGRVTATPSAQILEPSMSVLPPECATLAIVADQSGTVLLWPSGDLLAALVDESGRLILRTWSRPGLAPLGRHPLLEQLPAPGRFRHVRPPDGTRVYFVRCAAAPPAVPVDDSCRWMIWSVTSGALEAELPWDPDTASWPAPALLGGRLLYDARTGAGRVLRSVDAATGAHRWDHPLPAIDAPHPEP